MAKRKVDLNVATKDELVSLLGIDKSMAEAVVEYRKLYGQFNSVRDLALIPSLDQDVLNSSCWVQYCFVSVQNESLDHTEPSLPLSSSQSNQNRDAKWASKEEMSVWCKSEVELELSHAPQTSVDSFQPVATCSSHDTPQSLEKPGCSGQSSGSRASAKDSDVKDLKVQVVKRDPLGSPPKCVMITLSRKPDTTGPLKVSPLKASPLKVMDCTSYRAAVRASSVVVHRDSVQFFKGKVTTSEPTAAQFGASLSCSNVEDVGSLESDHDEAVPEDDLQESHHSVSSPKEAYKDERLSSCGNSRLCNGSESSTECECESVHQTTDGNCSKACHDKLMMKRKPDVDGREPQIGKKPCLTGSSDSGNVSSERPKGGLEKTSPATTSNLKKRIPTKDNPPPELASWLETFHTWGNAERLMAIDQLIDLCEPTQVRHMMSVIEPQFQRDFISLLPKELALYVLSFLEPKDLLRAAQTCQYWRILAEDNLLWREKCREAGIDEVRDAVNKKRLKIGLAPSPWKAAYMRQHDIEMNWRYRPIRPPKVLKGHDDHVITCLQFCGTRIVSGSDDNTLKVWSATTGKCLKTLVGHTGGVWSSQMAGNIIVSGSTDRTLKVWNADTGHCIHTLYGHTSTVRCMHLHGNTVVSGSRDATLRVWDIDTGQCLHVLVGHMAAVRCVQYDGRLVVSGAYDYVVKVWNPEREECLHTLQGHTNRVYSLQFDGIHVVSGSLDTSIRVWDVETGALKHMLTGHQSLTSGMELKNNILVSGNADSTVKVWDIATGQCLQTLAGTHKHNSAVTCLQFNSKFVITSSDDGTVKLWDLKTGEFIRNLVALESGGSGGVVWRIRASPTKLVCAVGSRNGTEETKLLVLDFDVEVK